MNAPHHVATRLIDELGRVDIQLLQMRALTMERLDMNAARGSLLAPFAGRGADPTSPYDRGLAGSGWQAGGVPDDCKPRRRSPRDRRTGPAGARREHQPRHPCHAFRDGRDYVPVFPVARGQCRCAAHAASS